MKNVLGLLVSALLLFAVVSPLLADEEAGYNLALSISYDDWTKLLKKTVFKTGRSDRIAAPKPKSSIGTRIYWGNKNITRLEANRLFYHNFTDETRQYVVGVRKSLEAVPAEVPLDQFSPNERLAYWLNLRNVAVVEKISGIYPKSNLRKPLSKITADRFLTVGGKKVSIRDIEKHVMKNWSNPLVVYGFYNGTIGGPNIRNEAFTGASVWEDLEDNAKDFVNSLRGLQFRKSTAKVSILYKENKEVFPNFEENLLAHLSNYADPKVLSRLAGITRVKPTVYDWQIADLYNGVLINGTAVNDNPAALISAGRLGNWLQEKSGSQIASLPLHAQNFVRGLAVRNKRRQGSVSIEEYAEPVETENPDMEEQK